jgi:thermitase
LLRSPGSTSLNRFHVSTHARLRLSGVGVSDFTFSAVHTTSYKPMLGVGTAASVPGTGPCRVAVIDSGIDAAKPAPTKLGIAVSLVAGHAVVDDVGHGTVIAAIIGELAPSAIIDVYKVAGVSVNDVEWDVLAALIDASDADVINLSIGFGLNTIPCVTCGRLSKSSRSKLFEHVVSAVTAKSHGPVLVAAAGNEGLSEIDYPARFAPVVAVGSVDSTKTPSTFSNTGALDADGIPHSLMFVAPGGQDPAVNAADCVGTTRSAGGHSWWGTSFSTAYVSGLLYREVTNGHTPQQALASIKANADTVFPRYKSAEHGNGIARL